MTEKPRPQIVTIGILTQEEFDDLSPHDQLLVEQSTADLVSRYGAAALLKERARHRADIWFAYGVGDP